MRVGPDDPGAFFAPVRTKQLLYSAKGCAPLVFWATLVAFVLTYGWMVWAGNRAFMRIPRDTDAVLFHEFLKHVVNGELPLVRQPITGKLVHYFLADHFVPGLLLVLPIWVLWPGNVMFSWTLVATYAACSALVFDIARHRLNSPGWASLIGVAFLLSPRPGWSLYNHLNDDPFLPLFFLLAYRALVRDQAGWYWAAIVGLLISREDAGLFAIPIGLLAWLGHGRRMIGATTIVLSVTYMAVVLWVVLPHLPGGGGEFLHFRTGYGWLGNSPSEALRTLLSNPITVLQRIHEMGGTWGTFMHLAPFAFLSLASWQGLIVLIPLSYLLLHGHSVALAYQYAYRAAAIAAPSAIEGVRQLRTNLFSRFPSAERVLGAIMLALVLGLHVWVGYSPLSRHFNWDEFRSGPRERAMRKAMALIPPRSRVSASRVYFTHLVPLHEVDCIWEHVEVRGGPDSLGVWCVDTDRPVQSEYLLLTDEDPDSPTFRRVAEGGLYAPIFSRYGTTLFHRVDRRLAQ